MDVSIPLAERSRMDIPVFILNVNLIMNCNNHFLVEGSLDFLRLKDVYDLLRKNLKNWQQVRCDVCGKFYMKHKYYIAKEKAAKEEERLARSMRSFVPDI